MNRYLLAPILGVALLLPASARADRLVIAPTTTSEPKLLLPPDFLARYKVAAPVRQEVPRFAPMLPTVMAGLALAIGVALAGILVARRASPRLVTGSAACLLGAVLFLNSSCSPRPEPIGPDYLRDRQAVAPFRQIQPPQCQEDGTLQGELLLEEGALGDSLRLVLGEEALTTLEARHSSKK